jgi:hypothetical protein
VLIFVGNFLCVKNSVFLEITYNTGVKTLYDVVRSRTLCERTASFGQEIFVTLVFYLLYVISLLFFLNKERYLKEKKSK